MSAESLNGPHPNEADRISEEQPEVLFECRVMTD
jgi:hypothetical protein